MPPDALRDGVPVVVLFSGMCGGLAVRLPPKGGAHEVGWRVASQQRSVVCITRPQALASSETAAVS